MAETRSKENPRTLLLIAVFKLLKGALLFGVAVGAFRLLHRDISEVVEHWVSLLRVDPDNKYVHALLSKVLAVHPNQLKAIGAGTFVYSGLLLTEGVGLLLHKRWAEYFTIITTAGLIPVEVYELAKHVTAIKALVLAVNLAIVVYLIVLVRKKAHS